jgi:NAD(P)H dehydrogenase (quinone)
VTAGADRDGPGRVVLVVAHPRRDSFCHALAARARSGLRAAGHRVDTIDLYAEGFRAAMTPQERSAYHGDRPILDPSVRRYADLVRGADALAFVYPTWWSGLPAVLKGFLERVLVPGVAFALDERTGRVRPALGQVRHIVGVSTYGSPGWLVRLANDNGRRTLTRALRLSCGRHAHPTWLAMYGLDGATTDDRCDFAARVERELAELR